MSVLYDTYLAQIKELVGSHSKNERNGKLLFAGWYDINNESGDIKLFEVYADFPDPGTGRLSTYDFPSSNKFPMKGSLYLTITSPSEMKDANERNDETLNKIINAVDTHVIYPERSDWKTSLESLLNE